MSSQNNSSTLIEQLFAAGAHFGFKKSRRHPTVSKFLFTTKDGNDIFDLEKTSAALTTVMEVVQTAAMNGKTILFVGTKEEIAKLVMDAALRTDMPYVTNRWIGGMLTNVSEIKKRINRLATLTQERESGELERKYTKKERVVIGREVDKLTHNFSGIAAMTKAPDYMVVVDPRHDHIAVREAIEMNVPVIGISSSDGDLSKVTHPIVVNDALQTSVSFVLSQITLAINTGKAAYTPKTVEAKTTPRRTTSA